MSLMDIFKKKPKLPTCSAVIVAAGSSQRMGEDKLMMPLGGKSVLLRTLLAFQNCENVNEIIVVTRLEKVVEVAELCHGNGLYKVRKVICGGATRAESALCGVSEADPKAKLIAIHDGARPFVSSELIAKTTAAANEYKAAAPVVKSVDSLKAIDGSFITATIDREVTVRVQTPQIFSADLIKGALTNAVNKQLPITDDCSAMELMGFKIRTVEGDEDNIKLTTPRDFMIAEAILRQRGEC